mgnify:CR=1 FL=1
MPTAKTEEQRKAELEDIASSGIANISITKDGDKAITYRSQIEIERQLERLNRKNRTASNLVANPSFDRGL